MRIQNGQSEAVNRRTDDTMAKRKRTNNDLQNATQKLTRTPQKTGGELRCSGRLRSSWSSSDTRRVTVNTDIISYGNSVEHKYT